MRQPTVPVAREIFATLRDKQSVEILGVASTGFQSSNGITNQTKKQYYVRLKRLADIGLIEKHQSIYKLHRLDQLYLKIMSRLWTGSCQITGR